ncbi:MAG TPA: uroporphyrinogen decarboxylase family protein [Bryobacteraceae bacterium]|nr:uroporphyrinogen decarboxylase family protein [Bryobacteraceae bacterium]
MIGNREELTPRERVLLALDHREADRVPVDFMATPETWARLGGMLGTEDHEAMLRRLGVDLRHPRQPYVGPPLEPGTDAWGVRRRSLPHAGGAYEEICFHPLAKLRDASELVDYPWPDPQWWDAEGLKLEIEQLDPRGRYAVALEEFGDPGGIFEIAWYLRGMEQFLMDLATRPEIAYEIMGRVADFYVGMAERVMRAASERIDLIWTSDDIAHQHGRLISGKCWRELVAPHHARLNQRIHELGTRVMYHSCGAVRPFIPGLVEIGVDVLDVLQFSATGMDAQEIKDTFGDRLSFHGGMDVQSTLPFCTEDDVRRITEERIKILGKGGGYIMAPTHNIQADTPARNIVTMYETAGSYNPLTTK